MLYSSSSSSFSPEDGSKSNSDRSSVILGDSEGSFIFRAACNSRRSSFVSGFDFGRSKCL